MEIKNHKKYLKVIYDFVNKILNQKINFNEDELREENKTNFMKLREIIKNEASKSQRLKIELKVKEAELSDKEIKLLYFFIHFRLNPVKNYENFFESLYKYWKLIESDRELTVWQNLAPSQKLFKHNFITEYPPKKCYILSQEVDKLINIENIDKINAQKIKILKPQKLYAELSKYIIGQEKAIKAFSSIISRHLITISINEKEKKQKIPKSNILIIGPTGCGKTYMCRKLSEILKIPFYKTDATQYTETGYVGKNVDEIITEFYNLAHKYDNFNGEGVIYVDEIDKIAAKDSTVGHHSTKDVSGLCVQQEMLKILENDNITTNGGLPTKFWSNEIKTYNLSKILFIASGAFFGIEEIIANRLKKKQSIGFISNYENSAENPLNYITPQDIIDYGFLPEFVGRFNQIIILNKLTVNDFAKILTNTQNSIFEQYNKILRKSKNKFRFTEDMINDISQKAISLDLGARGLITIMDSILNNVLFDNQHSNTV